MLIDIISRRLYPHICKNNMCDLLFRVAEVHRTSETTATPEREGANLSEYCVRTIRGSALKVRLFGKRIFCATKIGNRGHDDSKALKRRRR